MDDSFKKNGCPSIDFEFNELSTIDNSAFDAVENTLRNASSVGNVTRAGLQKASLQSAIDNYAQAMNQSAIAKTTGLPVKTSSVTYKGFAAEEYFKHTLKINALAKGVPDYKLGVYSKGTLPDGSNLSGTDMETDISVWTRKHPWSKPSRTVDYQSKMHNKPLAYKKDMANTQYKNVEFVGGSGQGVNDKISVNIGKRTVSSDSITSEEATSLADSMKTQKTPEYQKTAEKHSELNRVNLGRAVAVGATTNFVLTTVKEIVDVIKNRDKLSANQFIESVAHILCETAEGGIRGGAIMGSIQLLGKVMGKEVAVNSLGAVPVMVVANTAVDFAKDLYRCFVTGAIDADDLLCNTVNNTFLSFAGFGGAYVGAQIVTSIASAKVTTATGAVIGSALGPVGIIVGSVVGGILFGYGASAIIEKASKDAQKAFNECITEINTRIELSGFEKLYYFADSMSCISDFRLSFKNLLPCYNLISDLKEYNIRKKAIKSIQEQLDANIANVEIAKVNALRRLESQHIGRLKELQARFNEQREAMFDEFKESMNTYIANSYSQYIGLFEVLSGDIETIKAGLDDNIATHNVILDCARKRNKINAQLNEMLTDIMNDQDSAHLLKPFVEKLEWFMQQDELMVGRQYLSLNEALFLVNGDQS